MDEALAQAKLPPGVVDDGKGHVPMMLEGDSFSEMLDSLGAVLNQLLITPRNVLIIVGAWGMLWLFQTMVPESSKWHRIVTKHVSPVVSVAVCSWAVWQSGLKSHIESEGWRYVQGCVLGVISYFTYPLLSYTLEAIVKFAKRVVKKLFSK